MGRLRAGLLMTTILVACAAAQLDIVREPPKVTEPSSSSALQLLYREGQDVELQCEATGMPPPSFSWFWNVKEILNNTNRDMTFDPATGKLVIADLDKSKEGFFNCWAKNSYDGISAVSVSPKVEVRVARVGYWEVNPNPAPAVAEIAGNYKSLPCDDNIPVSYGPTDFKWYKVVDKTQNEFTADPRRFIDKFGTMHFTFLKLSDQTPTGTYYACALSNPITGRIVTGRKKSLNVLPNNNIQDVPPVLRYSSEIVKAKVGYEARLECFFSGYSREDNKPVPFPTTYWTDGDKRIETMSRFSVENEGRVLMIRQLRESDEGNYYCYGANTQGTASGTVFLNITSAPIWLEHGGVQSQTAIQGDDVEFKCQTRSAAGENPPNPPRWYHNARKRLDQIYDPSKYVFSADKQTLTLKTAQKNTDIGCFQCYVANSEGEVFSDGCVNVILPIEIITQPAPQQQAREGDLVNLTVLATSDPLVTLGYTWTFNGTLYEEPDAPPHVTFDPVTRLAFINTSGFSEDQMESIEGEYTRRIFNPYEEKFVTVNVTLTAPPVAEEGFDYWIIGLIIASLLLIILLILLVILCRALCRQNKLQ